MTHVEELESFFRAVYDAPADELPRLVFADWLEERNGEDFARAIRAACEYERTPPEETQLRAKLAEAAVWHSSDRNKHPFGPDPWFLTLDSPTNPCLIDANWLLDPSAFRAKSIENPGWFGATHFRVSTGLIQAAMPIDTLLTAPCTAKMTYLNLSGQAIERETSIPDENDPSAMQFIDYDIGPVITLLGVEALCQHRAARRLTVLRLRNNNLDNDAARLLERSTVLQRLTQLDFFDGNSIRGDTWSKLLARFGEDVVT